MRILILLAFAAVAQPIQGQDVAHCIERCFDSVCSGYPIGSSAKDACRERCTYDCKQPIRIWGAIAYSQTDNAFGYSYEMEDQQSARQVALETAGSTETTALWKQSSAAPAPLWPREAVMSDGGPPQRGMPPKSRP